MISIIDDDPVRGRALELLLCAMGYEALFTSNRQVELLLLAPGLEARRRAELLDATVPVLELVDRPADAAGASYLVWPCRLKELSCRIDLLLSGGRLTHSG